MTFSPRSALRSVSWYEIIRGRIHILILQWTGNALKRCNHTQYSTSPWRPFISEFHGLINMITTWFILGGMVLDAWIYNVLHTWFQHCGDCQCISNLWWNVKLSFLSSTLELTIISYTASAFLVPKQHRARVRVFHLHCQLASFIRSWIGWLVGGVAQYPRSGIAR